MVFVCPVHAVDDCVEERVVDGQQVLWCLDREAVIRRLGGESTNTSGRRRRNPEAEAGGPQDWARYARWNHAIAAALFDGSRTGRPVYLDLEDPTLRQIAEQLDEDVDDPADALAASVSATLADTEVTNAQPFGGHRDRLQVWRKTYEGPPPFLALLGAFSMAADRMHASGDYSAANYYDRLFEVLGRKDASKRAKDRLRAAYMKYAGDFWIAYDSWLRAEEGRLGLSTVSFDDDGLVNIGPAISQALVRPADHDGLARFFRRYAFQAGATVGPDQLLQLLRDYVAVGGHGLTQNLKRLIEGDDRRAMRVAELASSELENWDGVVEQHVADTTARAEGVDDAGEGFESAAAPIRLSATLSTLFDTTIHLSAVTPLSAAAGDLTVDGAEERIATDLSVVGPGLRELDLAQLDPAVWLNRSCRLDTDAGVASRTPDNVVVLRWDEMLGAYLEQERISLGDAHLVLVRSTMAKAARDLLVEHSRPTPELTTDIAGLPTGWRLIRDVQLLEPPEPSGGLARLTPPVARQLVLGGGTRLPGRIRRFHLSDLPEIRVSAFGAEPFDIVISQHQNRPAETDQPHDDEIEVHRAGPFEDAAIVSLDPGTLGRRSGDFGVAAVTESGTPLARAMLRVRQGTDIRREASPIDAALGWSATWHHALLRPTRDTDDRIIGVRTPPARTSSSGGEAPDRERVWQRRHAHDAAPSTALQPNLGSAGETPRCFEHGAHHFVIPTFYGRARGKVVRNECKHCGLVLFTPARPPRREGVEVVKAVIDTRSLQRVAPPTGLNMDYLLDALTFLEHGPWPWFTSLVRQRADSALDVVRAARRLEALGHLEIERDARLQPTGFEVAAPSLFTTTAGREAVLAGARSRKTLLALRDAAKQHGTRFGLDREHKPARVSITGDVDDLRATAAAARLPLHEQAAVAYAETFAGAQFTPDALTTAPLPPRAELDLYDLESGSWVVSGGGHAGAFRVRLPGRRFYALRTPQDVRDGLLRPGPHQLVRHMAASQAGITLLAYDPEDGTLSAPRNIGLPPPLERAAVLCSGRWPWEDDGNHAWVYGAVPTQVAANIATALRPAAAGAQCPGADSKRPNPQEV